MQNTLIQEGKEMASILYTYRSCVKALPQVLVKSITTLLVSIAYLPLDILSDKM